MKIHIYKICGICLLLGLQHLQGQGLENILRKRTVQEINARIAELERENRRSGAVLYLKAAVEPDGKKALSLYEQVVLMYPKSAYADDAKFKIGQYYFSIGFYNLATEHFRELIWQYPNSPLREGASYYSAQCLIALDRKTEARRSLRQFIDQFRTSDLVSLAIMDLKKLEGQEIAEFPASRQNRQPSAASTEVEDSDRAKRTESKKQPREKTSVYSIQVGAFLNQENARRQQRYFKEHGYQAEILNKRMGGKYLYVVCLNRFSDYDKAVNFGKKLNEKYRVSFQVIQLDDLK